MAENPPSSANFLTGLRMASFFNRAQEMALAILFPAVRDSLRLNYLSLGILESIRILLQAAGAPLWKLIADRGNRKWVLAAFAGFWGIWTVGCGLAGDFRQLLIARTIACLGFGCFIPLTISLVKDAFDDKQSERVLLVLDVGGILGMVVAAIVLAELLNITAIGWRYGFVILGSLSILVSGGALAILVENPRRQVDEENPAAKTPGRLPNWLKDQFTSLAEILKRPIVWLHAFQGSLVTITVNTLIIFSVTWLVDVKHLSQIDAPFVFAAMLVSMAVGGQIGGWLAGLAETRWPKIGRIAATQAAMLLALPVIYYLVLKANALPIIMLAAIFVAFFINWNRHCLQQPQLEALLRPALQNKATFWIELVQAVVSAAAIVAFSHYADNRNLTALMRILVIDVWAAALVITSAYYLIFPLEMRRK